MYINNPYPTSRSAELYVDIAKKVLKDAINVFTQSGTDYLNKNYSIDDVVYICKVNNIEAKVYIISESTMFSTNPKSLHPEKYPWDLTQRGIMTQELDYIPPSTEDTESTVDAGNCYWHGEVTTLSWKGSPGFNIMIDQDEELKNITVPDLQNESLLYPKYTAFDMYVYENEEIIWEKLDELVLGACYYQDNLIVITRRFGTFNDKFIPEDFIPSEIGNFILTAYLELEPIAEILVGRFNNIWNFKTDGSAGICLEHLNLYRLNMFQKDDGAVSATFSVSDANDTLTMPMNTLVKNTTSKTDTSDGAMVYGGGIIPLIYASLLPEEKAAWLKLKNKETTEKNTNTTSASGSSELVIGYGYDDEDNEVPLIAEITLTVEQYYEQEVYRKNDAMLVLPENSHGVKVNGYFDVTTHQQCDIINIGPCGIDANTSNGFQQDYLLATGEKISRYFLTKTLCPGDTISTRNCTGDIIGYTTPNYSVNTLQIVGDLANVTINRSISATGGIGPYTWSGISYSVDAISSPVYASDACKSSLQQSIKVATCPASNGTITLTDACGRTTSRNFTVRKHWVQKSYTDVMLPNLSSCSPCTEQVYTGGLWGAIYNSTGACSNSSITFPTDGSVTNITVINYSGYNWRFWKPLGGWCGDPYPSPMTCISRDDGEGPYPALYGYCLDVRRIQTEVWEFECY